MSIAFIGDAYCFERRRLYSQATQKYVIASSNLNFQQIDRFMYFSFVSIVRCTDYQEIIDIQPGMQREQIDDLDSHLKFSKNHK